MNYPRVAMWALFQEHNTPWRHRILWFHHYDIVITVAMWVSRGWHSHVLTDGRARAFLGRFWAARNIFLGLISRLEIFLWVHILRWTYFLVFWVNNGDQMNAFCIELLNIKYFFGSLFYIENIILGPPFRSAPEPPPSKRNTSATPEMKVLEIWWYFCPTRHWLQADCTGSVSLQLEDTIYTHVFSGRLMPYLLLWAVVYGL